jgi:MFS family permease
MSQFSAAVLKDPNAARLVVAQLVSQLCDKLLLVAVMWLLADRYDASWLPWYVAAGSLPHLALAWWAGGLIARLGGLRIVIVIDLVRGLLFLAFPLVFWSETPPVAALLGLTLLANAGGALFNPAMLTLPLSIVPEERRTQVNALIDMSISLAAVAGPVLSVVLFARLGLPGLMIVNGASYLIAGLLQIGIKPLQAPPLADPAKPEAARGPAAAPSPAQLLGRETLIRNMLLVFLGINLFGAPFVMYLPLYVKSVYAGELGQLATLEAAMGIGAIIGAFSIALRVAGTGLGKRIIVGVGAVALAFAAFAATRSLYAGAGAVFVLGIAMSVTNIWILTYFQSAVPAAEVGVVMGMVNLIVVAGTPLSMGAAGLLIDRFPVTTLAAASAVAVVLIAAVLPFVPRLRSV